MNDTYLYGEMFSENILTSYRIYGDRKSLLTPLIILHGGPSGGFDYLLNYRRLAVAVHKKRERDPKKMRHHVVSHLT